MVHHMQGNKSITNSWLLIKTSWGQKAVGWNPNCLHLLYLEAVSSASFFQFWLLRLCHSLCSLSWALGMDVETFALYPFPFCCSVAQSCPTLCDPVDCSRLDFPVHHHLPELAQIHVHWVSDAIQPSYPLWSSSPPAFYLSQHQGLFQSWFFSSGAKVLKLQLQHQSFQWIFRVDFL